jgi:alpha-mannosidase
MRDVPDLIRGALAQPGWVEPRLALTTELRALGSEPVPYAEAVAAPFAPAPVGTRWGVPWDTGWFRFTGAVPADWAGDRVVASVDLGWPDEHPGFSLEALVYAGGQPVRGICRFHEEVVVTRQARGGEAVELYAEAAANPGPFPGAPTGVQHGAEPLGELRRADLVRVSPSLRRARLLLEVLGEALDLAGGERRTTLEQCLTAVCDALVAGTAPADVLPDLEKLLVGARGHGTALHLAANSHLDTAWLWPVRETRRKVARTLATALEVVADHPGHAFAFSQPAQLAWLAVDHPGLFERVRAAVAAGTVEMVGASWVEPDTNVPSGESLVRQLTHGLRYVREQLGVDVGGLWLPDVFGYSAQLPQLLRQAGLEWFMTSKLGMNDTNRFPHRTFWWEGIDGSRVLAHMPPADTYNGSTALAQLDAAATIPDDTAGRALYLYGYGDGGGGPTREMVERLDLLAELPESPRFERGTVHGFFDRLRDESRELPVWVGELYFELHRGTYTTQAQTKTWHRRAERALLEAEVWAAAARATGEELRPLWEDLLLQQFHDIIPGSSIAWVHDDAVAALRDVHARATLLGEKWLTARVGPGATPVVVNPAPVAQAAVVVVDGGEPVWASAPSLGWAPLGSGELPAAVQPVRVDGASLDNGLLRVTWDTVTGHLVSVRDLEHDREVLDGPGNVLQVHDDNPRFWDAWDLERRDIDRPTPLDAAESVVVTAPGPLVASVRIDRHVGQSRYVQTVELHAGSRLVRCRVDVDWQERHTLLKVAFPVAVRAPQATYEIQYGALSRPTHRNTSWDAARFEVCAQQWADLSEAGYGVALLNDSRHGYDVHGSTMRLSLLRSPTWPDAEADRGQHSICYALLPHPGDAAGGGVVAAATAYNRPLRLATGEAGVRETCLVSSSEPGAVIAAVKPADDGDGVVVRVYEAFGGRRRTTLHTSLDVTEVTPVDLRERPTGEPQPYAGGLDLDLAPFEVRTLHLR